MPLSNKLDRTPKPRIDATVICPEIQLATHHLKITRPCTFSRWPDVSSEVTAGAGMIVKERGATKKRIAYLETFDTPGMDSIKRQGLKQAAALLRADCTSDEACRHIDSYFANSEDWMVIHAVLSLQTKTPNVD